MEGLYHLDWTKQDGSPRLRFWLADEAGRRLPSVCVPFPFKPHFFAAKDVALAKLPPDECEITEGYSFQGREMVKIEVDSPDQVTELRDFLGIEDTCEADVPYARRVMIETGLSVSAPKSYVHVDIETDPSRGVPDPEKAEMRVLSVASRTNTGEERFFSDADERTMLAQLFLYMDGFPVVCTFNGNHFDWPYLMNRVLRLGMEYWFEDHVHIDLLAVYKFVMQKRQDKYSLEHIAKEEKLKTQKRKIDIARLPEHAQKHWSGEDTKTLQQYNLDDVRIIDELDQKYRMVGTVFSIASITRTLPKDLLRVNERSYKEYNTSVAVDGFNLYLASKRSPRVLFKTKEHKNTWTCTKCDAEIEIGITKCPECQTVKKKGFSGAMVIPPVPGLHRNVVSLDVASLYPTIIQSFNMGPETYVPEGYAPGDWGLQSGDYIRSPIGRGWFRRQPQSTFSEMLGIIMPKRKEYKKLRNEASPSSEEYKAYFSMDYAYKVLLNSVYGVLGASFSRYFNKDVAENVTLTGQKVVGFLRKRLESYGNKVIYGDTDSVFFTMDDMSLDRATQVAGRLTEETIDYLEELSGIRPTLFRLEVAELCDAIYFQEKEDSDTGTKKRYAALVTWKGTPTFELLLKGFEVVRHDSSEAQKDFQTEGLMLVLTEASADATKEFCVAWWEKLLSGELDDKIVMWKGLGKAPDEYKVMPPYLRVGKRMEAEGKIILYRGSKIPYVKVGPDPEQVVAAPPGEKLSLTEKEYAFIWDSQFVRIARRLGLPVEEKVALWKKKKSRRKKGGAFDHPAHPGTPCSTLCDETDHFRRTE